MVASYTDLVETGFGKYVQPYYKFDLFNLRCFSETVMMIATMIANPPSDTARESGCATTLIIVPTAVLIQCRDHIPLKALCSLIKGKNEIILHAEPGVLEKVVIYDSSFELSSGGMARILQEAEVM